MSSGSEKKHITVDERLRHIAFIMDGNGRWAQSRNMPREYGHKKGAQVFREICEHCNKIGINPNNDGTVIRLIFPQLTEERRKELAKQVQKMGEEAKVAVRNIRRAANDEIKKLKKDGVLTEDDVKDAEKKVQDITDKYIKSIDAVSAAKEKEIMKV